MCRIMGEFGNQTMNVHITLTVLPEESEIASTATFGAAICWYWNSIRCCSPWMPSILVERRRISIWPKRFAVWWQEVIRLFQQSNPCSGSVWKLFWKRLHWLSSQVNKNECLEISRQLHLNESTLKAALMYLNELSLIFYYPEILPNHIFTNPQLSPRQNFWAYQSSSR